jgi:glucose-6-phosphate isomerase
MSNAVMGTHCMIFVTIGNLVSPSSSVNGDPLFDFPDHWQPRFSVHSPDK